MVKEKVVEGGGAVILVYSCGEWKVKGGEFEELSGECERRLEEDKSDVHEDEVGKICGANFGVGRCKRLLKIGESSCARHNKRKRSDKEVNHENSEEQREGETTYMEEDSGKGLKKSGRKGKTGEKETDGSGLDAGRPRESLGGRTGLRDRNEASAGKTCTVRRKDPDVDHAKYLEEISENCHQCQRHDKGGVIRCKNCKKKRYCFPCASRWYPHLSEDEIAGVCPFCRKNCNCKACLRFDKVIPMGKAKVIPSPKKPSKSSSKSLGVSKPPIPKKSKGKGKKSQEIEILYVKTDSAGIHYGRTSVDPTRYIMAPSSVSRADGDLERDTPPTSPRADNSNKFTMPKPYEFDGPMRFNYEKDTALHKALTHKGKWPIPLLFPEIEDLKTLEVFDEIKSLLGNCGLSFIFRDDPGSYHEVTMEFLSSFSSVHKLSEDEEEEKVKCWKFAMGDYQWEVDSAVLCDWFRLPRDGLFPKVVDDDVFEFWKRISGREYTKEEQHKSTSIRIPVWKIIHKFLAGIVFVRTGYGRLVTKLEMMLMLMIERGQKVDWLWCITKGIKDNQIVSSKNRGFGGGSFVTWIARKLNFTFGDMESEKLRLTLKQMRSRHILGKGLNWKNCEEDSEGEKDDEVEDEIDRAADHDMPSSSHAMPPPSSTDSSLDLILSRLDAIARVQDKLVRNQNFLATYVSEHNKWEERTLLAITTHLDISSSVDLPPKSPFLPRSPSPPSPPLFPTANEKMGENVQKSGRGQHGSGR